MGRKELYDLDVFIHVKTDKAVFVSDTGEKDKAVWLPLSQIEINGPERGQTNITAPEWLLIDKGLV